MFLTSHVQYVECTACPSLFCTWIGLALCCVSGLAWPTVLCTWFGLALCTVYLVLPGPLFCVPCLAWPSVPWAGRLARVVLEPSGSAS